MPVLMTADDAQPDTLPPFICHLKRPREDGKSPSTDPALCGDRFGAYAVAKAGAELLPLLPFESTCEVCAAAHVAGDA